MQGRRNGFLVAAVALALIATTGASLVACGEEGASYGDKQIADKLNLDESENGYAIDGDPFCEVEGKLLNDADEVSSAADKDKLGLVIASAQGNVGIIGVPPFAPDCKDTAKKKLNRLDPKPKE